MLLTSGPDKVKPIPIAGLHALLAVSGLVTAGVRIRLSPPGTKPNHHLPRRVPVHCPAALLPVGLLRRRLNNGRSRASVYEFNLIYRDAVVAWVFRHIGVPS